MQMFIQTFVPWALARGNILKKAVYVYVRIDKLELAHLCNTAPFVDHYGRTYAKTGTPPRKSRSAVRMCCQNFYMQGS